MSFHQVTGGFRSNAMKLRAMRGARGDFGQAPNSSSSPATKKTADMFDTCQLGSFFFLLFFWEEIISRWWNSWRYINCWSSNMVYIYMYMYMIVYVSYIHLDVLFYFTGYCEITHYHPIFGMGKKFACNNWQYIEQHWTTTSKKRHVWFAWLNGAKHLIVFTLHKAQVKDFSVSGGHYLWTRRWCRVGIARFAFLKICAQFARADTKSNSLGSGITHSLKHPVGCLFAAVSGIWCKLCKPDQN